MSFSEISSPAWFCVRSQPKHEHIAAAHLKRQLAWEIDVFNPKLRIRRRTKRGAVWFVEALFPGYLFARFNASLNMQKVRATPGVSTVVSFGLITPTIPDQIVESLRADFGESELHEVGDDLSPGDEITITRGPFQGMTASVISVLPAPERVRVLLEMLGRNTLVQLDRQDVIGTKPLTQLLQAI